MLGISGNAKDPTQNRSFTGDLSRMSGASSQMSGMGSNMMRSIARLWCHECTRVFGDRILLSEGKLIQFFSSSNYYRLPTKLREGNVFTGVCHSVHFLAISYSQLYPIAALAIPYHFERTWDQIYPIPP